MRPVAAPRGDGDQPSESHRSSRTPVYTRGGVAPTGSEFSQARAILTDSRMLEPLQDRLDSPMGRPRSLSVEALLVAMLVNSLRRHHRATIVEITRLLNAFSTGQLAAVGVKGWDPGEGYDRTDRLFNKLCSALEAGWEASVDGVATRIDDTWFANRLAEASLLGMPTSSKSLAVDGTAVETWATMRGDLADDDVDGVEAPPGQADTGPRVPRRRPKAQVLGIGSDGRKIYTADRDARAGHRSAVTSRGSGPYVGYELHLAVQTRDVRSSNGVDQVSLGDEVPAVITSLALVAAGSHRGDAIVPHLLAWKAAGHELDEVVWDRGYSQLRPETTSHLLHRAGVEQAFRPMETQRKTKPYSSDALVVEGQLFSAHLPAHLRGPLAMPPMGAPVEQLLRYEQHFNQRAGYRYQRHAGPDADGVTRWRCPFCSGLLRARSLPKTMRRSRSTPLIDLPEGEACCHGTVSISAADLPLWQRLPPGTTAWRISMGRRQVVEGANAGLKGGYVNIERKFMRVLGRVKMTVMLACTVVGYNVDRIRAFVERTTQAIRAPKRRAKRREGTWEDILGSTPPSPGPDPPPD